MITIEASESNFSSFLSGSSTHTWQPIMAADTATLSYWLNWRFTLCALFILTTMVVSAVVIWKFEGRRKLEDGDNDHKEAPGVLYQDEAWNTCLRSIHPAWLLSFRIFAFFVLLALLLANVAVDGTGIFYFYTQWTFTLVTIYFGFGSAISIYGCQKHWGKVGGDKTDHLSTDFEGTYTPPVLGETANVSYRSKRFDTHRSPYCPPGAGACTYAFQIMYQSFTNSWRIDYPSPILTAISPDFSLSWSLPIDFCRCSNTHGFSVLARSFSTPKGQRLRSEFRKYEALLVCMHSVNAVFLVGDTILNCMRFPFFRIAYFVLWTGTFVVFQWIIHACINLWWPYPFLDLSSAYAPLWYMGVGVMHIPCYVIFALMIKLKDSALWRSSPESFRKKP
ncbi:hypothetical protein V6N12_020912 [Hibiscus sabdariffa]|uniref:Uncharacterized protein n=1 Tax=Hibiscus sabdariffa TaxID=183260 RepID=A0ABR2D057_9ROSI